VKGKIVKFIPGLVIMAVFYTLAIVLWKAKNYPLFLFNFSIMGTLLGLGFGLWPILKKDNRDFARKLTMLLTGSYIFFGFGLGLIYPFFGYLRTENFQFEGFLFYLLLGGFAGTVYHYTIAKIIGPFLFGRTFCGWVCWTAAILDYLPWEKSGGRIGVKWEFIRYILFFTILGAVLLLLFVFNYSGLDTARDRYNEFPDPETIFLKFITLKEFWWFVVGNFLYYLTSIILAAALKDNRAFCKYVCPITVLMKIGTGFSILKIKGDRNKCTQCGTCERQCMMNIQITDFTKKGKRISSTECIQCRNCVRVCPNDALSLTFGFDSGFGDHVKRK